MTEKVTNFIGTKRVGRNNEHLKLVIVDDTRACNDRSGIGFGMGHLYDKVNSGGFSISVIRSRKMNLWGKTIFR